MKVRLSEELQVDSIVDGEGIRTVIWFQGCSHNCKGCHNPATHSFKAGYLFDVEEIKKQILELQGQDGVTLSGGDPLFQIPASLEIAKFCKQNGLSVWCYTGFTFEELIAMSKKDKSILELLENIDILVDGRYIEEQKDLNLKFRGSKNQRIINVKQSLKKNKTVKKADKKEKFFKQNYGKLSYIYI